MLALRFGTQAGRIELSSDAAAAAHLAALRVRFTTASSASRESFDVSIDDFLLNLYELARWPEPADQVRWQPELLALVETNSADAELVRGRLASNGSPAPFSPSLLGGGWIAPLNDEQQRDLGKLLELRHGANFSVPGAGKTRVSLAAFQARRDEQIIRRALVVCPKSAFESWYVEAALCFGGNSLTIRTFDGQAPPACDLLLVNYERLPDSEGVLLNWLRAEPALLVLDEAHRMKLGPAGAWGSACLALAPYAARRMILTGTPAPNGLRDLENLFSFVWPGLGRAAVTRAVAGNDLRTASGLLRPLFVRTTKKELALPPVETIIQRIDLPALHRELYDALVGQASARLTVASRDAEALGRILLYLLMAATTPALLAAGSTRYEPLPYRVPPLEAPPDTSLASLLRDLPYYELSPKYQRVAAIVADNASKGRKTLVWSTFVRNLTSLERLLSAFQPAVVHGGTEDRAGELERFRSDPECLVLLSNPATLGEGVSLHQVCHDAIYVDRDFAAGRYLQSLDRIHRLGLSPGTVTRITVLAASNTVDDLVESRLSAKLRFMGGVLDDPAVLQLADLDEEPDAAAGMDAADMQALIEYVSGAAAG